MKTIAKLIVVVTLFVLAIRSLPRLEPTPRDTALRADCSTPELQRTTLQAIEDTLPPAQQEAFGAKVAAILYPGSGQITTSDIREAHARGVRYLHGRTAAEILAE